MIPKEETKEFGNTCSNLSTANLKYVIAVANALKFSEDTSRVGQLKSSFAKTDS